MRETIDFGIDLGTTNSAIAVMSGSEVRVIKNNEGWDYTPSAVAQPRQGVQWVGRQARDLISRDPDSVATEFKLEMGLADARRHFPKAKTSLTPQQLSAEVLKSLRADVAHDFSDPPEAAVITVPAAFALNQIAATNEAAALAGFTLPCPLVQEPTAAAYAYGFNADSDGTRWMVFDFGGGTFDAAVVSNRDGEMQVLHHSGDPYLGGKLIDWAIVDRVLAPAFARAGNLTDFRRDNPAWRENFLRLKEHGEAAKIALSRKESVSIELFELRDQHGREIEFIHTLTRDTLDSLAEPYYARAVQHCRNALANGGLAPSDIHQLVLVGGTTLAPGLRAYLSDPDTGLGIPVDHSVDPITVVARGAAIYAGTVRLERPLAAPKPGEFALDLAYEPSVTTTTPVVGGRIHREGSVDLTRYGVTISTTTEMDAFRTPRIQLAADGSFSAEVMVSPLAATKFRVLLTDGSGNPQRLAPSTFTITHREVEFAGPVLPDSVGIGVADNRYDVLLRKGQSLPARATGLFQTTIPLRRSDPRAVIRIPVYEGDRRRGDRNYQVALLEIRAQDIRFDLPQASDVEITIEVDRSRLVTVVADVPLLGIQLDAKVDMSQVRTPDAESLHQRLEETRIRLAELSETAAQTGAQAAQRRIDSLQADGRLDDVAERVRAAGADRASAADVDRRLRDLETELDEAAEAGLLPQLHEELLESLEACEDYAERLSDHETQRDVAVLRRQAEAVMATDDVEATRRLLDRVNALLMTMVPRLPEFELLRFHALRSRHQVLGTGGIAGLLRDGERAVAVGDRAGLSAVNERLRRLLPDEEQDSVDGAVVRRDR